MSEFHRGHVLLSDEVRQGRPAAAVADKHINAVWLMIENENHTTYDSIQASLGIGRSLVQEILHDHLSITKVCARWVPHNWTESQKRADVEGSEKMLKALEQGCSNHVYDIVIEDETWIHCYEPKSKRQLAQWVFPG